MLLTKKLHGNQRNPHSPCVDDNKACIILTLHIQGFCATEVLVVWNH